MVRKPVWRRGRVLGLTALACWLSQAGGAMAGEPPSVPFVAHHAVYKLTLIKSTGSKAPASVDGMMTYDFSGSACEGYTTTLRQMTALQPQEGDARVSEMQTASFEDADARDYHFRITQNAQGGKADAPIDGDAQKTTDGKAMVKIASPQREKLDLPQDVLFPTEHLMKIIATAKTGGRILSAKVFDGSDTGTKVFTTLTVIGSGTTEQAPEAAAHVDGLKDMRRWPVVISYFDSSDPDGAPEYVLSFGLYEDGISRDLRLDYGDFVLAGEMTELKLTPEKACAK